MSKPGIGVVADVSLTIQILHDRSEAFLVPIGELDVHSSSTFSVAGDLAIEERPSHLHVDLSQVTFIDSSGVRGVEALVRRAGEAGVACSISGRTESMSIDGGDPDASLVVWSGSSRHVVPKPETPPTPPI